MSSPFIVVAFDDSDSDCRLTIFSHNNEISFTREEMDGLVTTLNTLNGVDRPYWRYYEIVMKNGLIVKETKQAIKNEEIYTNGATATKTGDENVNQEHCISLEERLARDLNNQSSDVDRKKRKYVRRSGGGSGDSVQPGDNQ